MTEQLTEIETLRRNVVERTYRPKACGKVTVDYSLTATDGVDGDPWTVTVTATYVEKGWTVPTRKFADVVVVDRATPYKD